ncbi:MAG: ribonuclease D [Chloroflexi bacterium]|nr:ribonuclease D [Chloroflexota bacterium]
MQPPILITTSEALALLAANLRKAGRFALDTESNSMYAYYHRVCLVQVSTETTDYIIDALALRDLAFLQQVTSDPEIEVVIHAAENDLLLLDRDFGLRFARVFDTMWAARILGWPRVGLASLLQDRFGVKLDKRMQRTDWGKRPLSRAQLEYARLDTHYLLRLRDQQEEELRKRGRWEEAQDLFASLTAIHWEEKEPPDFWRLAGVHELSGQELAVLEALFQWRENRAQRRDVPPYKILRTEALMALAREQPQSTEALRRIKEIPKRLPEHLARALIKTIRRGRQNPPPSPPERQGGRRPDPEVQERYERLRSWRTRTALERGVDADVVLTNQVLKALARAAPRTMEELANTDLLTPWKLRAYGPDILEIIGEPFR